MFALIGVVWLADCSWCVGFFIPYISSKLTVGGMTNSMMTEAFLFLRSAWLRLLTTSGLPK
ncbi:hypothetical protein BaRGS_00027656, partial [Batillaria attramentaria]